MWLAKRILYFKGQGEVDVILLRDNETIALEVKWAEQIRPGDLKTLKQFHPAIILTKNKNAGLIDGIDSVPVYEFMFKKD